MVTIDAFVRAIDTVEKLEAAGVDHVVNYRVDLKEEIRTATKAYLSTQDMQEMLKTMPPATVMMMLHLYDLEKINQAPTGKILSELMSIAPSHVSRHKKNLLTAGYFFEVKGSSNGISAHKIYLGKESVKLGRIKAAGREVKESLPKEELEKLVKNPDELVKLLCKSKALSIYTEEELIGTAKYSEEDQ